MLVHILPLLDIPLLLLLISCILHRVFFREITRYRKTNHLISINLLHNVIIFPYKNFYHVLELVFSSQKAGKILYIYFPNLSDTCNCVLILTLFKLSSA